MSLWTNFVSGSWSDSAKWTGGIPNVQGAQATFNMLPAPHLGGANVVNISLGGGTFTIGELDMSSQSSDLYNINTGTLVIQAAANVSAVININTVGAAPLESQLGSDLTLQLNSNTQINTNGAATVLDMAGTFTGAQGLTKAGAGTLQLHHTSSGWTGGLTITAGRVEATAINAIGAGALTMSAGTTLDMNQSQTVGALSGAGTITNSGGTLATLTESNATAQSFNGLMTSSTLAFTKNGAGTLTVGGAMTHGGATTINAGTLKAGFANILSSSSNFTVASGATLDLGGNSQSIGALTGAGAISSSIAGTAVLTENNGNSGAFFGTITDGTGFVGLTKQGAGTLTLNGVGNTYSSTTTVSEGALKGGVANAFSANSNVQVDAGGILDLGGFNQTIAALSGTGAVVNNSVSSAVLTQNNAALAVFSGGISDGFGPLGLTKTGAGTLTLGGSGLSTYSGTTQVVTGSLKGGAANAFSASSAHIVNGGTTLDLGGYDQAIGALSGSGNVTSSSAGSVTLTENNAAAATFNGQIVDGVSPISFVKNGAGTLTITLAQGYTGSTLINGGKLALTANGTINQSSSLGIDGGTFDISGIIGGGSQIIDITNSGTVILGGKVLSVTAAVGSAGNGAFIGSNSADGLFFTLAANAGNFDLSAASFGTWTDGVDTISITGNALGNQIVGTTHADTISGGAGNDVVFAGAGLDNISGGANDDTLVGNADIFAQEADTLSGGDGNDTIYGENSDTILGGLGFDVLYAVNDFNWTINLSSVGIEYMRAGFGDDAINGLTQTQGLEIYGGGGSDAIDGSAFNDFLWGDSGNDTIFGGNSDDVLVGGAGADSLSGGNGDDQVYIDAEDTTFSGDAGANALYITGGTGRTVDMAATGFEWIADFASGSDTLSGAALAVNMTAYAGGGIDVVTGGSGNDFLWGEAGNDTLTGNNGSDVLVGGIGADVITGGAGIDNIYLNSGGGSDGVLDRVVFTAGWGTDFVFDFVHGQDKLDLTAFGTNFAALAITNVSGHAYVHIGAGTDLIAVAGNGGLLTAADFIFV